MVTTARGPQIGNHEAQEWMQLIRSEYLEMPGLNLTLRQAMRLWNLDEETCRDLLEGLVRTRFLSLTASGAYRRLSDEPSRAMGRVSSW